jgi:DNA polymerase
MPYDLEALLRDDSIPLVAHSASFDYGIVLHALKRYTAVERWRCTKAQAYAHGLPGSLEMLGAVLRLPQDKQKLVEDGKLIHTFCVPQEDGSFVQPHERPEDWTRFKSYAIRDTDALREIYWKLPQENYKGDNLALWALDQKINTRGFGFDTELAEAAVKFLAKAKEDSDRRILSATDGAVQAATQRDRMLIYLQDTCGVDIPNLRAAELRELLEGSDINPVARMLIEMRLEGAKSSGSKYRRGLQVVGPGNRIRHGLQFCGAGRTGRWSGKGYQPHNMTRPVTSVTRPDGKIDLVPVKAAKIDAEILPAIRAGRILARPNEAAALALRHAIIAAPGNELVVADWSNIESRVLAWLADETWKLEAYRALDAGKGVDLYRLLFSQFFGTAIEDVNDTERQSGKVSELAFGFGGGVGALVTMAAGYQMDLDPLAELVLPRATDEQRQKAYKAWRRAFLLNEDYTLAPAVYQACDVLKQTYRQSNAKINELRHDIADRVKQAMRFPRTSFHVGRCTICNLGSWLVIELPSKRRLLYANPRMEQERDIDPDTGEVKMREFLTYATARGKTWRRERSWSGLFVENIVQGTANDLLRAGLIRADSDSRHVPAVAAYLETLPPEERTAISLHVHDEVVMDVPVGSYPLERLIWCMTAPLPWSEGLPLAANGWVNARYGKR